MKWRRPIGAWRLWVYRVRVGPALPDVRKPLPLPRAEEFAQQYAAATARPIEQARWEVALAMRGTIRGQQAALALAVADLQHEIAKSLAGLLSRLVKLVKGA